MPFVSACHEVNPVSHVASEKYDDRFTFASKVLCLAISLKDGLKIVSVGNGNPRGFDSFKDVSSHPLYYGQAMVIVRRTRKNGKITLAATADGLRMAKLSLGF